MLKEDKVISIITILGTALAITLIMVIVLTQRIKTTNIEHEMNRERTMYITYTKEIGKKWQSIWINPVSIRFYKQYLSQLTAPEKVSLVTITTQQGVSTEATGLNHSADIRYIDAAYWNIYSFSFIAGKSFTEEEFQSGIPVVVISKSIARKLFNTPDEAMGNMLFLYKKPRKVIGVVEDVSTLCNYAYAQVWIPYTSDPGYSDPNNAAYNVILLAKDKQDFSKIKSEVRRSEIANNLEPDEKEMHFYGPFSGKELLIKTDTGNMTTDEPDLIKANLRYFLTLFILLLIPAINLSGFSLFKIINRTSEIGIRKAFGADKKTILMQVLYENFLTSVIGGIIGLGLSYIAVSLIKDRLFTNDWFNAELLGENKIPISAFISPAVFFYVFLACVLLNLLSSGISAWRASRLNIVSAIRN